MAAFTLDTSGVVSIPSGPYAGDWTWETLPTDFLRGYGRAALESGVRQCDRCQGNGEIVTDWDRYLDPSDRDPGEDSLSACPDCSGRGEFTLGGFSDLHPSTLEAMMKDCGAALGDRFCGYADTEQHGAMFWADRQANQLNGVEPKFPPLTLSLGDDGLIYQREAGQ